MDINTKMRVQIHMEALDKRESRYKVGGYFLSIRWLIMIYCLVSPGANDLIAQMYINNLRFEPIHYQAGPPFGDNVHAFLTMTVLPAETVRYLNANTTHPVTGKSVWIVENLPLLPSDIAYDLSYIISIQGFGDKLLGLRISYRVGAWQNNSTILSPIDIDLVAQPCTYDVPSGTADPPILVGSRPPNPEIAEAYRKEEGTSYVNRDEAMPNVDLDASKEKTDHMACGPAAAANSLQWLKAQHKELQGDTTSVRSKLDSLKKFMNRGNKIGVRFDSMVVGKLTLVDQLKLPIRVKYQTKHDSGNTDEPLKSTKPPFHTADNKGKKDVFPDFDWLKKEMDEGEDVEIHVGWYGPPNRKGVRERLGGHWLVVSGYVKGKNAKGVYVKDDVEQSKKGGLRSSYFRWGKDRRSKAPILEELKDDKGNIAVIESVVSESYDPEIKFDPAMSTIPDPWENIDLTDVRMKPGYPFVAAAPFPWLPVVGGVVAVGIGTYLLVNDNEEEAPCTFSVTFQTTNSTCGQANGSVTGIPTPDDDYIYEWSNGTIGATLANVPAGTYSVTITRSGTDCIRVTQANIGNTDNSFDATITTQDTDCDKQNGSATVSVMPEGNYNYQWSNGSSAKDQTDLAVGMYSLTVSAGGECIRVYSVQIAENPFDVDVSFTTTPASCGLSDGSITAEVNPSGAYTYAWSNGGSGQTISDIAAGAYTLTVSISGTTCLEESSVQLEELPAGFSLSVSSTDATCGLSDGTASVVVDPPGAYTYTWSDDQTGEQISGLAPGTYQVTVAVSGSDCQQSAEVAVGSLPFPYDVTFDITPARCGTTDGLATANVTPQGEFGYQWSDGSSSQTLSGASAGTYQLTVTDIPTSCSGVFTVTIDELPADFTFNFTTTPAGCGQANGSVTSSIDPPGAYEIQWSNGSTTADLINVPAGSYTITATLSGTSCTDSATVIVDQTGITFNVTTTSTDADCGMSNGTATAVVDPPGEYQYQWSNNQSGPMLQGAAAGTYTITVSDQQSCMSITEVTIGEQPADYIEITGTTPGDCVNGGDITFNLTTPSTGPMEVTVSGPEGSTALVLSPGIHMLSSFISVPPGAYTFLVIDQSVSSHCRDSIGAEVEDSTVLPEATDDFYTTPGGQALTGNALQNDIGLSLTMTQILNVFGGTVTFDEDGTFTFSPENSFSGEASFEYTVTDACGNTSTGLVIIFVEMVNCDFEAEFTSIPASCGLEDGTISLQINPGGNYDYIWSNGDSGPVISNLFAGSYTVTVTDLDLGCTLQFTTELAELPSMHIEDVVVIQPECSTPGDIQFTATSNSMNPLVMIVDHPNGSDLFFIEPELIVLSDYISITSGEYTITVFDAEAGADCADMFSVTLDIPQGIEIVAEAIIPPTEPTAMDGIAIIVAIVPGQLPYEILLNGASWGVAIDHTFPVDGLGPGEYTIQIVDATGCASNVLTVVIPFPGLDLLIGTTLVPTTMYASNEEPVTIPEPVRVWRSMLTASMRYYLGSVGQEFSLGYALPVAGLPGILEGSLLTDVTRHRIWGVDMTAQVGIGGQVESNSPRSDGSGSPPAFIVLKASAGYTVAKRIR